MIGSCDYCGEYCAELSVAPVEWFEEESESEDGDREIPEAAIDEHNDLVMSRLECRDGHVGPPAHDDRGVRLLECPNCSSGSEMDLGEWDTTIDHSQCPTCWSGIAGGHVLDRWRAAKQPRRGTPVASTRGTVEAPERPSSDRRRAEAALRAYAGVDLPTVSWVPSPVDVVRALGDAIDQAGDPFDGIPDSAIPPWSIRAMDATAPDPGGDRDERGAHAAVIRCVATALSEQRADAVGSRAQLVPVLLADAGELAAQSDAGRLGTLLDELRTTTGAVLILPNSIVVSERALRCSLDDRGRPHAAEGPAIAYRDGFTVYAWHGVVVPEWLIRHPERVDIETIDAEANVEVRRVMVERFGAERLIREGGAELVHQDGTGRLWRRTLPTIRRAGRWGPTTATDEPMTYVEVVNSTPEPDGSRRTYFLRVPPTMRTAREAVAWTFALDGDAYSPVAES